VRHPTLLERPAAPIQLRSRLIPIARVLGHCMLNDELERFRNVRSERAWPRRLLREHHVSASKSDRPNRNGRCPVKHMIEKGAYSVDVGREDHVLAPCLLRRHVARVPMIIPLRVK